MDSMEHITNYFSNVRQIAESIDAENIEELVKSLVALRERGGRLFFIGVGGSAANCSHAVNDFRKLCGIESYAPTDNVAELTARINDEGWDGAIAGWLKDSRLSKDDALFVLSVGGGDTDRNVSVNLVRAMDYAVEKQADIFGIVGRDGGYAGKVGSVVVLVPTVADHLVTPLSEAFQAVIWHCLVSHPRLQLNATKW